MIFRNFLRTAYWLRPSPFLVFHHCRQKLSDSHLIGIALKRGRGLICFTFMKRRNEYSEGSSPLRKRISSLFSIPSVRDDDDDPEVVEEHKHENSGTDTGTVIFFDEEDGMMRSLERREPESSKTYLPSVSLDASDKTPTKYQTGLVIESGNLHYDRSNRLHKERPLRIETVVETLKREGVYDQCIPLKDRIQLEDEDYYQTHMYGYMYR